MLAMFYLLTCVVVHRFHFIVHPITLFISVLHTFSCVLYLKLKDLYKNNNKFTPQLPQAGFNSHNSVIIALWVLF